MAEYTAVQKIEGYYGYTAVQKIEGYYGDPAVYTCPFRACVHHHCNTANHTKKGSRLRPLPLGGGSENPSKALPPHPPFGGA